MHSHSYTGNALACSAALATLEIFRRDHVLRWNRKLAVAMSEATAHVADHPRILEVHQRGMILAIEMVRDRRTREPLPWQERRGLRVYGHGLANGVMLRPLGNVVCFMLPYLIAEQQVQTVARVAWQAILSAVQD